VKVFRCLVLATTLTACAGLIPIAQDVASIVQVVAVDIKAGKPFEQVLIDTGSDDAQVLVAIIGAILADPKTDAPTKAAFAARAQPYLDQATVLAAKQRAARGESP
jgi:hypothetical protein